MQSVYLDNTLGFHQDQEGNLEALTKAYDDGTRSVSTISSYLASLGIPKEKVVFAIKHYTKAGREQYGAGCPIGGSGMGQGIGMNQYKKNNHNMQLNLKTLANIIGAVKTTVLGIKESNVNKINYSANASYSILESISRELYDLNTAFNKIDENKDDLAKVALIKESLNPAVFKSKPEFYLLNKSYQQLKPYDGIVAIKEYLEKCEYIFKENFYTNYLSNMVYEMLDLSERKFYSEAIEDIQYLLKNDENYIKENLTVVLNKYSWIPRVQQLLERNSNLTKNLASTNKASVEKVYSPVQVNEDGSYIFTIDSAYYQVNKDKTLQKITDVSIITEKFNRISSLLKSYKIDENKITLYKHNKSLELLFEDNKIKVNGVEKEITDFEGVKDSLIGSGFFRLDEVYSVDNVLLLVENMDMIKSIDVIDRIIGHNGNIVNIIKLSENNIYINRVNKDVLVNELFKADNANQAQTIVNEYVEYDISNSVYEILEKEDKIKVAINEQIKIHEGRVIFLNEQLKKVKDANLELNSTKLNEASKLLKDELRKEEIKVQKLYEQKSTGNLSS